MTRIFPAWKRSPEAVVYSGATMYQEDLERDLIKLTGY